MNKEMFLNILIQSLNGEVSPQIIEQNVKYYDQYIGKHSKVEEKKILSELGDPRLIAKTIIEAERVAKQKSIYGDETSKQRYQQDYNEWHDEQTSEHRNDRRKKFFYSNNNNLYYKIKFALILIIVIFVLIIISSILIRLLFIFFPIIILLLCILFLFRRR